MATSTKHPKRSVVWKYFTLSDCKGYTKCLKCDITLKYITGNTTNMRSHLTSQHPAIILNEEETDSTVTVSKSKKTTEGSTVSTQNPLLNYVTLRPKNTYKQDSKRQKVINKAIAEMIVIDILPFSIVEGEGDIL